MQANTFAAFAALADKHGATALSAVLRACTPGAALPQISFQCSALYNRSFATWSYGSGHRRMIEGFPRLDYALLAGIRHLVAPVQPLELRIATRTDWAWLNEFHSGGTNGQRTFQLYEDTRLYWHIPDANLLLLTYTEPKEFGRREPALKTCLPVRASERNCQYQRCRTDPTQPRRRR